MIKQTLYFGNPVYLSLKNRQLEIKKPNEEDEKPQEVITRSIEDIGIVILDHGQITITHKAIIALQDNNVALLSCDDKHMPASLMLPLKGHSEQTEKYRYQIDASLPLKRNLWQQTIRAKIQNQIIVLDKIGKSSIYLQRLIKKVESGDPRNIEGQAAVYYWKTYIDGFLRDRYGDYPNNLLNYGYAIIRAMVARGLVASGMLPSLGIFHRNKYNAYCLADDIMEPYRPFVDLLVYEYYRNNKMALFLNTEVKRKLLSVCTVDAQYSNKKSPLMVGVQMTTSSLAACYQNKKRKINYPLIV